MTREDVLPLVLIAVFVACLVGFAVLVAGIPSCEELGGSVVQTGTQEQTYKVTSVKVGEVDIPIYGTRTVPVYDCLGER